MASVGVTAVLGVGEESLIVTTPLILPPVIGPPVAAVPVMAAGLLTKLEPPPPQAVNARTTAADNAVKRRGVLKVISYFSVMLKVADPKWEANQQVELLYNYSLQNNLWR